MDMGRKHCRCSASVYGPVFSAGQQLLNTWTPVSITVYEFLYYLLYGTWFLATTLSNSEFNEIIPFFNISQLVAIAIVAIDLLFDRHTGSSITLFIITAIIMINCYRINETWLGMSLLVLYCGRNVSYRNIVKISVCMCVCSVVIVLLGCLFGLIPNLVVLRADLRPRYSLGFYYPSFLPGYLLGITLGCIYLRAHRITYGELITLAALSFILYIFEDTKSAFIFSEFVCVLFGILKHSMMKSSCRSFINSSALKRIGHGAPIVIAICALLSTMLICVPINTNAGQYLDKALSGRLQYTQTAFAEYGVSLFGNDVKWSTNRVFDDGTSLIGIIDENGEFIPAPYMYVDSSYLQMLVNEGVITFLFVLELLIFGSMWLYDKHDYIGLTMLCIIALHSIFDPQLMQVTYSFFICCIFRDFEGAIQYRSRSILSTPMYKVVCVLMPLLIALVAVLSVPML